MSKPDAPIACTLDGPSFDRRVAAISALFRRALRNSRREGASLHLTFAPEARAEVEELVHLERACCAFLTFDVQDRVNGVELTVTAPSSESADDLLSGFSDLARAHAFCACPR
jgi:hypothetical protein